MRYFNTSGPNIPKEHYTLQRENLIEKGIDLVGVVSDNASPFNIADDLNVPYFTVAEVRELLLQHETEAGGLPRVHPQQYTENQKHR